MFVQSEPKMQHLFKNMEKLYDISLNDVYSAYLKCRRRKRNTTNLLKFEVNLEDNLVLLWEDLCTGTYEIGKSLTFLVTRPKLREVFAADFRDRIVHHLVMNILEPLFEKEFINDTYNCRKGKGVLYGVNRLYLQIHLCEKENPNKLCWIFKFDFSGFFMSIHKPTLWKMLEKFIINKCDKKHIPFLLWIVKKIVFNCPLYNCYDKAPEYLRKQLDKDKSLFYVGDNYGLPIGNLTSLWFANFYLNHFDHEMVKTFKFYGRYVDDFFIISVDKNKVLNTIPLIREQLKQILLIKLHHNKFYCQPIYQGCKFIGSVVKRNRIYIGNLIVDNFFNKIKENDTKSYNSYFGFLCHHNSYKIAQKALQIIQNNGKNINSF